MDANQKTHTVVVNGQRVTGSMTEAEARAEAERRNQITESSGKSVNEGQKAKPVQNLMG